MGNGVPDRTVESRVQSGEGGIPFDVLGYLWSIRKFLPVGILVAALVFGASLAISRMGGASDAVASGTVLSVARVETPSVAGGTADAAAAAATLASLTMTPAMLDGVELPQGFTAATLRPHVTPYSSGVTVNLSINGLPVETAKLIAKTLTSRIIDGADQVAALKVGGEPVKVIAVAEPYMTATATSSRSKIQSYLLAGVLSAGVGITTSVLLGWWAGRRRESGPGER
jgi:hypothetical protein